MSLYELEMKSIDGTPTTLEPWRGQVLLIVNVASKCGYTKQYEGLEALHRRFKERGFAVLGYPCDQFGHQEPGDEEEIQRFCSLTYDVTFPMFAKIEVNGANRDPLYAFLTSQPTSPDGAGDIQWNFAKFLVDRAGNVVARFAPPPKPVSEEIVAAIEGVL